MKTFLCSIQQTVCFHANVQLSDELQFNSLDFPSAHQNETFPIYYCMPEFINILLHELDYSISLVSILFYSWQEKWKTALQLIYFPPPRKFVPECAKHTKSFAEFKLKSKKSFAPKNLTWNFNFWTLWKSEGRNVCHVTGFSEVHMWLEARSSQTGKWCHKDSNKLDNSLRHNHLATPTV